MYRVTKAPKAPEWPSRAARTSSPSLLSFNVPIGHGRR
jgi:hypothetical protein